MNDKIIQLTDDSFESDVLNASGLVLVDFWAEWCGPCKMIAPILDDIADEYQGQVVIGKLNIDQNSATPPNAFLIICAGKASTFPTAVDTEVR